MTEPLSGPANPLAPLLSRRDTLRYAAWLSLAGGIPLLSGCGTLNGQDPGAGAPAGPSAEPGPSAAPGPSAPAGTTAEVAMSKVAPATPPAAAERPAVAAVTRFSEAMLAAMLRPGGGSGGANLGVSPYSVAVALGMTVNGARGSTAQELLRVLGGLSLAELDAGLAALELLLRSRSRTHSRPGAAPGEVALSTANSLWGQRGLVWEEPFLDALASWFGAGLRLVDYAADPEAARRAINTWTSTQTRTKIPELLAAGVLTADTRMVLVNALYFKAPWATPFEATSTAKGPFRTDAGTQVTADFMVGDIDGARVARGPGWVAASLPYVGHEVAMTLVLADRADPAGHAELVAGGGLAAAVGALAPGSAQVTMPRWTIRSKARLKPLLSALGMPTAFSDTADFSGMTRTRRLTIDEVVHEGYIAVDEAGTEAAAATAVIARAVSAAADPLQLSLDRPFLYVLHDVASGLPFFVGRVGDPTQR